MFFNAWRDRVQTYLPIDVQFLEKIFGPTDFNFWIIEAIMSEMENVCSFDVMEPISIKIPLHRNKVPKSIINNEQYEYRLTRETTLSFLHYQQQGSTSPMLMNPPHIIPVVLYLIEPEKEFIDKPLARFELNLFNILPFLIKISLRAISPGLGQQPIKAETNQLHWDSTETDACLQIDSPNKDGSYPLYKINNDPLWIGKAKVFPPGFTAREEIWDPSGQRNFNFLDDFHARLDWDGKKHWIWNTGSQEVWLGGEKGSWKRVLQNQPYPLQSGQSIVLGRLFETENEPIILPGSVRLLYKCS